MQNSAKVIGFKLQHPSGIIGFNSKHSIGVTGSNLEHSVTSLVIGQWLMTGTECFELKPKPIISLLLFASK